MIDLTFNCPKKITDLNANGNHFSCETCQHQVFDFRNSNQHEIAEQLKNNNGKTCGIVYPEQVNKNQNKLINITFLRAFYIVFFLGMAISTAYGQESEQPPTTIQSNLEKPRVIKGTVVDSTGKPITFAKVIVQINNDTLKMVADFDGQFICNTLSEDHAKFEIMARYIGFSSTKILDYPIGDQPEIEVEIKLKATTPHLVGLLIISPSKLNKDPYELSKTTIQIDN